MEMINQDQLILAMNGIAEQVIIIVSEKVLQQLQENINKYTYEYGGYPNKDYYHGFGIPTFQFKRAWELSNIKKEILNVTRELFHNWAKMDYEPDFYLHGSEEYGDVREMLAEYLNVSGNAPTSVFYKERQPYWDITMEELFGGGGLEKMFSQELSKFGFIKS